MEEYKNITIVQTCYRNIDFVLASLWSVNRFFKIKVIIADGDANRPDQEKLLSNVRKFTNLDVDYISCSGSYTEDARNEAVKLVDTEYILFMDSDVKLITPRSIPILYNVFENNDNDVVQTGVYFAKVINLEKRMSFVSTTSNSYMEADFMPCYFSMHKTDAYRAVGGMPKEFFYPMPNWFEAESTYNGDFTITRKYQEKNFRAITPIIKEDVCLHWTQSTLWLLPEIDRPGERWYYDNVKHIRVNPFDDYPKMLENMKNVV